MTKAFSTDYVKTYMPEFMSSIRKEANAKANGLKFGTMARATRESNGSTKVSPLSDFPQTKRVSLAPTKPIPKGTKKQGSQYILRKNQIFDETFKLNNFLCSEPKVNLSKMVAAKRYRDPVTGRFSNNED